MLAPQFDDLEAYKRRRSDVGFWRPHIDEILGRHGLSGPAVPEAGFNATHPTFLIGDLVLKLFGRAPFWKRSHAAELQALGVVTRQPRILAPRLVAEGRLAETENEPWPYLITSRVEGTPMHQADLRTEEREAVAAELGEQLRLVAALPIAGMPTIESWSPPPILEALARSSFPAHLSDQVPAALDRLGPVVPTFAHGGGRSASLGMGDPI